MNLREWFYSIINSNYILSSCHIFSNGSGQYSNKNGKKFLACESNSPISSNQKSINAPDLVTVLS